MLLSETLGLGKYHTSERALTEKNRRHQGQAVSPLLLIIGTRFVDDLISPPWWDTNKQYTGSYPPHAPKSLLSAAADSSKCEPTPTCQPRQVWLL